MYLTLLKFNIMNEQVKGLIRHVLTFVGGIVVAKGWIDASSVGEIIGAVITLTGTIWSIASKK